MVHVIHAIRGRARYAVEGLYHSSSLGQYLERHLSRQNTVRTVSANDRTGHVLVTFDLAQWQDCQPMQGIKAIADHIEKLCFSFQADQSDQRSENKPTQQEGDRPSPSTAPKRRQKSRSKQVRGQEEQPIRPWHTLDVETVLSEFNTALESGLSEDAAAESQIKYGSNVLSENKTRSDFSIFIEQFQTLPVALLGGASVLSVATGGFLDAAVILGVVGINAVVGYLTESQSEHIIQSLQSTDQKDVQVIRGSKPQAIPVEDVVPGDILVLEAGQVVAADARLLRADNLRVNESSLTGESVPVAKQVEALPGKKSENEIPLAERSTMVYRGTVITGGTGRGIVVATGLFTEIGRIQKMVSEAESEATPLQQQLDEVGSQLAILGSGICGLVFGIGFLRNYGLLYMLKISISLAVAAVPEGLPTIATTTLALGMRDMRKRHILIRTLEAVEALGSIQTICLDKTGTLTKNQMVVKEVRTGQGCFQVKNGTFTLEKDDKDGGKQESDPIAPWELEELARLIEVGVLCSETNYEEDSNGDYSLDGSSTENALIHMAIEAGIDVPDLRSRFPCVQTYLRDEKRNVMSTVHSQPSQEDEQQLVAVKGSPGEVLERCQFWMGNGEVMPLDDEKRRRADLDNERMAGEALRVLGVAFKRMAPNEEPENNLIWLGLVGMADPVREGVQRFIQGFQRAGINTVMITGDQSPTAYAIAKELKLSRRRQIEILDSSDLAGLDDEKRTALFDKVDVFARVSPASKLAIVQALQAAGKVVAMTGDGINDMPALKAADVGVAMGSGSSGVVHDVADMVIEDNNLETLINAVSQGRTTYNNIRKSVHFLLSTNLGEIIVATFTTAMGLGEPLNTMELLWLNLVTDVFPGLALAMEPPEPDILDQPPRDPDEPILRDTDFSRIALESTTISVCALVAYGYSLLRYGQSKQASTTLFMGLTIGQVLHTWSCRSETHSIFHRQPLPRNPYVEGAIALSLSLQLLPIFVPFLRNLLQLAVLDPLDWGVIISTALLALLINETTKTDALLNFREQSSKSTSNQSLEPSPEASPDPSPAPQPT